MPTNPSLVARVLRPGGRSLLPAALAVVVLAVAGPQAPSRAASPQEELAAMRDRLAALESDLSTAAQEYDRVRARLTGVDEEIRTTERAVRATAKKMMGYEAHAEALAEELYKNGLSAGIQGMMTSESIAELDVQLYYLESSEQAHATVFEKLEVQEDEMQARLADLEELYESVEADQQRLAELQDELQAGVSGALDEISALEVEIERAEQARLEQEALEAEAEAERVREVAEVVEEEISQPPPSPPAPPVPSGPYSANWDAIAMCESGGNWSLDSTYDGGLQFHPSTWLGYGGGRYAPYAWQASREQQIAIAEKVLAGQGPGAWPNCFVPA